MKKALRDAWCAALRSGKYEQGKRRLRRLDNTFCCLGVLCDIAGAEWAEFSGVEDDSCFACVSGDEMHESFPPEDHLREWGLDPDKAWELAYRNDGSGNGIYPRRVYTFAEQADWIEEHVPCESE